MGADERTHEDTESRDFANLRKQNDSLEARNRALTNQLLELSARSAGYDTEVGVTQLAMREFRVKYPDVPPTPEAFSHFASGLGLQVVRRLDHDSDHSGSARRARLHGNVSRTSTSTTSQGGPACIFSRNRSAAVIESNVRDLALVVGRQWARCHRTRHSRPALTHPVRRAGRR
jgi:hypothetical protein